MATNKPSYRCATVLLTFTLLNKNFWQHLMTSTLLQIDEIRQQEVGWLVGCFVGDNLLLRDFGPCGIIFMMLRAGRPGGRGSIPGRSKGFFPLASVSRPALRPTQPPVQWVPGVLSPGVKRGRGVMLTTHPHLVPRS
jgi:hypothetical protein